MQISLSSDIVFFFLDIGGNDATTRAALDIAQDIVAYANYLVHGLGVVNVVIG